MSRNLDCRNITDLVIASLPDDNTNDSFQLLNGSNFEEGERKFGSQLTVALTNSDLYKTKYSGAYLALYQPMLGNKLFENIAVKILEPIREGSLKTLRILANFDSDQELQTVVNIPGYVTLENFEQSINAADLKADENSDERTLVHLAREHMILQKHFGKFILPAVFVVFTARGDIYYSEDIGGDFQITTGDKVYAMVQNFEVVRPIIINENLKTVSPAPSELTESEAQQILEFADLLVKVYLEEGIVLDLGMLVKGNLCITESGNLVLIDTNNVLYEEDADKRERDVMNIESEGYGILKIVKALRSYAMESPAFRS